MNKDIKIEYDIYEDVAHVLFEKMFSESGELLLQHLNVTMNSSNDYEYRFFKPQTELDADEVLYHVSSVKQHKEIKKNGLKASVGYCYANHWLSFTHGNKDIEDNLQPGVFFTRKEPLHYAKGEYFCVSVRVGDLNPDKILIDDAFGNDSSVFYDSDVPADKLTFID